MRGFTPAVFVFVICGGALSPADASACSSRYAGLLERAEGATHVALTRGLRNGLRVEESLAGDARSFRIRGNAACPPDPRPGRSGVVLADARLLDSDQQYVEDPSASQVDGLRRFLATRGDAEARRRLLVDLATDGDADIARDAVHLLGMRPSLLRAVTPDERRRLIASVPTAAVFIHLDALGLVLARLHDVEAIAPLLGRMEESEGGELGASLQLLTMHRQRMVLFDDVFEESVRWSAYRRRHRPTSVGTSAPSYGHGVAMYWRRWLAQHPGLDAAALWDSAFAERGLRAPDRDDREALARTMLRAPDAVLRTAALDRCEQLAGRPLSPYRWAAGGGPRHLWRERAEACRAP